MDNPILFKDKYQQYLETPPSIVSWKLLAFGAEFFRYR